ncbi:hypothetical protein TNCV_4468231 [Trichonephila clavipes]|nr:hypothetical protein TNCV_4468231 [Trichonephila clavipes]
MYIQTFEKTIRFKHFYLKQQTIHLSQSTGEDAKLACIESDLKPTIRRRSHSSFRRIDDSDDAYQETGVR